MGIRYVIRAKIGTYTDKQTGQEKNQYVMVGKIIETKDQQFMMKLDSVPLQWDGWAYLETPQQRERPQTTRQQQQRDDPQTTRQQQQRDDPQTTRQQQAKNFDDFDDDIPW